MAPHGTGFSGTTHSHSEQYPDDTWNLYAMLDPSTTALNVTRPERAIGIFKPFVLRLEEEPQIMSDADAEIIVIARFTSPVHVRRIMIVGGGDPVYHPSQMRCFVNSDDVDFTSVQEMNHAQQFALPVNVNGTVELIPQIHAFTNITTLAMYFPANHGDQDNTIIKYIGLQGEHTHYRREAVDAVYEVLCNGQDIRQPEDQLGAHTPHMH